MYPLEVLLEFVGFFLFILIPGYFLPAGQFYYLYQVRKVAKWEALRIQQKRPTSSQIRREIWMSIRSVLIFAIGSTVLLEMYKAGLTNIYRPISKYPFYVVPSFLLLVFLHDTWFYWTHRFMHWPPVFKYFHLDHHRSVTPTPWAIFAFSIWEAILQFLGLSVLIVFLPMCPIVLMLFLWYDTIVNVAGHSGIELVPSWVGKSPLFKWFNTVRHHDSHHTNVRVNYGSFLNVWDRWMGTFQDHPSVTKIAR